MKLKTLVLTILFWFLTGFYVSWDFRYPVAEPDIKTCVSWDVIHSGLLQLSYDLNGNKNPDYFTLRVIVSSFYSDNSVEGVAKYFPSKPVFSVQYKKDRMFYVGQSYPLFYAYDFNEDGLYDLLFHDVFEDGVNGNEEYYDSPSDYVG
jgi:hypothetical protein